MSDERFWAKVDASQGPDACWEWMRGVGSHGYGQYYPGNGAQVTAHRHALMISVGPPPEGKPHALHARTCISKRCVNPKHLRWGTHSENMTDAGATGAMTRPRRLICPSGHAMTPENTIVKIARWKGREYEAHACRECNRLYLAARRVKRKDHA